MVSVKDRPLRWWAGRRAIHVGRNKRRYEGQHHLAYRWRRCSDSWFVPEYVWRCRWRRWWLCAAAQSSAARSRTNLNYICHGDFGRLVLRWTYLFCNLVDLRIDFVEPVKRETPANQENGGKTGRQRSGRKGLSKCSRGCYYKICQPMCGNCLG